MPTPDFITAPWDFADDLETALINVLTAAEIEIPQPGAQVLDYIEAQEIAWTVGPEDRPGRKETKGRLPRGYVWVDTWEAARRGVGGNQIEVAVSIRMLYYASTSTSLEEGHNKARSFAAAVSSLFDQLALRTYDDVPIDTTPLLDDWRAFANGMPATVRGTEVDVQDERSAIIGRARLVIDLVHDA